MNPLLLRRRAMLAMASKGGGEKDDAFFRFLPLDGSLYTYEPDYGARKDDYRDFLGTATANGYTFKYVDNDTLRNGNIWNSTSNSAGFGWTQEDLLNKLKSLNAFTVEYYIYLDSSDGSGGYSTYMFEMESADVDRRVLSTSFVHARMDNSMYYIDGSSSSVKLAGYSGTSAGPQYDDFIGKWIHVSLCVKKDPDDDNKILSRVFRNGQNYRNKNFGYTAKTGSLSSSLARLKNIGFSPRDLGRNRGVAHLKLTDLKIYDYEKRTGGFSPIILGSP